MAKNIKVEGENVKELTFEVKDLNLDERIEFNNISLNNKSANVDFGAFVSMVRIATTYTDDEINKLSDTEIFAIANRCYEVVNKKKLKK